jgi:hypothetical protein
LKAAGVGAFFSCAATNTTYQLPLLILSPARPLIIDLKDTIDITSVTRSTSTEEHTIGDPPLHKFRNRPSQGHPVTIVKMMWAATKGRRCAGWRGRWFTGWLNLCKSLCRRSSAMDSRRAGKVKCRGGNRSIASKAEDRSQENAQ